MMKLNEIAKKADGTYVGTNIDKESKDRIKRLVLELGVQNGIRSDKMHVTLIYSRKYVPTLKAETSPYPMKAIGSSLEIFPTQDDKNALVMKLKCDELIDRHNQLMSEYQTTYDYDEYIPHITLSYDCGDFDPTSYTGEFPLVTITDEYVEDLVLYWQNKEKKHDERRTDRD